MTAHRELYPEQYTPPLVGKRVQWKRKPEVIGKVTRVFDSRWGKLAHLDCFDAKSAVAVSDLIELK